MQEKPASLILQSHHSFILASTVLDQPLTSCQFPITKYQRLITSMTFLLSFAWPGLFHLWEWPTLQYNILLFRQHVGLNLRNDYHVSMTQYCHTRLVYALIGHAPFLLACEYKPYIGFAYINNLVWSAKYFSGLNHPGSTFPFLAFSIFKYQGLMT